MESKLRPVEFYVLLVLADGDAHGYSIIRQVERRTGGDVRLQPGTLYRALDRLVRSGYVRSLSGPREPGSTKRRAYTITDAGVAAAGGEASRLQRLVREAGASGLLGEIAR